MGNRAVITTKKRDLGVYLHWNGGRDSVGAFLEYCELRGFRAPDADPYGWARLCQVVCNYMGADGLSVGISRYEGDARMDPGDNGIYVIEGWRIARRLTTEYGPGWEPVGMREVSPEEEQDEYGRAEMLRDIDAAQPEDQRLGAYLDAEEVPIAEVAIGDEVFMRRVGGRFEAYPVAGVGDGRVVNGLDTSGVPYVAMYGKDDAGWSANINNYLRTPTVRRARAAGPIGRDIMDGILAVTDELRARVRQAFEPFEGVYRINDLGEYVSEGDWREVWGGRPAWHEKAWMLADNGRWSAEEVAAMSPAEIEAAYGDPAFEPEVAFYTEADEKGEL